MKRKEIRIAAAALASIVVVSGTNFSTQATQVSAILPVAGVSLTLQEGHSVEDIEQIAHTNTGAIDIVKNTQTAEPTETPQEQNESEQIEETEDSENITEENLNADAEAGVDAQALTEEEVQAEADAAEEEAQDEEEYSNLVIAQVNDWVNVRSGPSTDSEIIGKLYNNSVGEMIRQEGDWYYIASGTINGYVKAEYCVTGAQAEAMVDEVSVKTAVVNAETLNFRSEPSTNSVLLKQLGNGTVLDVVSTDYDGWVEVNVGGTTGYVSAEYVKVEVSFVSAESKEEEEARLAAERAAREEEQREAAARQAAADAAAQQAAADAAAQQQTAQTTEQALAQEGVPLATSYSGKGSEVASFALQYVGNPYVYGGTSLTNGADCSGFVLAVYAHFGISLPHSATADRSMGVAVGSLAEAQPGDLVCYSGHVGIYIGNGQIVHASTPRTGIKISDANYKPIACIRRIFY